MHTVEGINGTTSGCCCRLCSLYTTVFQPQCIPVPSRARGQGGHSAIEMRTMLSQKLRGTALR